MYLWVGRSFLLLVRKRIEPWVNLDIFPGVFRLSAGVWFSSLPSFSEIKYAQVWGVVIEVNYGCKFCLVILLLPRGPTHLFSVSSEGIKNGFASGFRWDSTRMGLGGGGGSWGWTTSSDWLSEVFWSCRIFWNSSRLIMSTDLKLLGLPVPSSVSSWMNVW